MGALGVLPPPAPSTGQAPFAEAGKVLGQGPEALPVEALLMDAALEAVEGFAQRLLLCDLQSIVAHLRRTRHRWQKHLQA